MKLRASCCAPSERRPDAEHGYASLSPSRRQSPLQAHRRRRRRPRPRPRKALKDLRSVHNELEKHRRAQLRQYLEQLKQQVPISRDHAHYTTLSLLHQARLHIKASETRWF
ncbi:hypothetical protein JRQ81_002749 [Phrynocephalus forsythii]|uniref:Max dimerization protein 3 n=1 Tax=Phrynocephalus forsythii TaxID=171643 RepID=A0A9Q0XLT3_9SAUR|nr:hypothetical protein JRQ81_002749 [Phrynocephalus forsythii]